MLPTEPALCPCLSTPIYHLLPRRRTSPANIPPPRNRIELQVIVGKLPAKRTCHQLIDAFDLVDALAQPVDDPAEGDVGTVVEDLEDLEGRGGRRVEQGRDVGGFGGEGDGVELW